MNKLDFLTGLGVGMLIVLLLTSCTKEPIYRSDRTVADAIMMFEDDAIKHGIDLGDLHIDYEVRELPSGHSGQAFKCTNKIYISDRWKGSDRNINTVYHEIGHLFGLDHGVHDIMSAYNTTQTRGPRDTNLDEFFFLIRQGECFDRITKIQ